MRERAAALVGCRAFALLVSPLVFRAPCCLPRWARLLDVPVGGGPPASRPRRELRSARRLEARPGPAAVSEISHVIPLGLFQDLNCGRWNCNVCGRSPKVTVGNYVRLLFSSGPAAAHRHCGFALPLCNPASPISHVIPLGLFQDLNWRRWNCNVSRLY